MVLRIIIAASALAVAGLVLAGLAAAALGSARAAAKWPSASKSKIGSVAARVGIAVGVVFVASGAAMGAWLAPLEEPWMHWGSVVGAAILSVVLMTWGAFSVASKLELSALINTPAPPTPVNVLSRQTPARPHWNQPEIAYGQPYPGVVSTPQVHPEPETNPVPVVDRSPSISPEILAGQESDTVSVHSHTTTRSNDLHATQSIPDTTDASWPTVIEDPADPVVPADAVPGWVYSDGTDDLYLVVAGPHGRRIVRLADFAVMPVEAITRQLTLAGWIEMTVWPVDDTTDSQNTAITDADTNPSSPATPTATASSSDQDDTPLPPGKTVPTTAETPTSLQPESPTTVEADIPNTRAAHPEQTPASTRHPQKTENSTNGGL